MPIPTKPYRDSHAGLSPLLLTGCGAAALGLLLNSCSGSLEFRGQDQRQEGQRHPAQAIEIEAMAEPASAQATGITELEEDVADQPIMVGGAFLTVICGHPDLAELPAGYAAIGCRAREADQDLGRYALQASLKAGGRSWAVLSQQAASQSDWQVNLYFASEATVEGRISITVADGPAQVVVFRRAIAGLNPQESVEPASAWWHPDWSKRRKLLIDTSGFTPANDATLESFPVLVKIAAADPMLAEAHADGHDIRFIDPNGAILPYEIESFSGSGNEALLWVRLPALMTQGIGQWFWLYYGNPSADQAADARAVWDEGFLGVYHFAALTRESTRQRATTNQGATLAQGFVGNGVAIDTGRFLEITDRSGFPRGKEPATLCGMGLMEQIKTDASVGTNRFGWLASWGEGRRSRAFFIGSFGTSLVTGAYGFPDNDLVRANFWTIGRWHYICQTFDGLRARLYADGVLLLDEERPDWDVNLLQAFIGRQVNNLNEYWPGRIDEIRISNVVRSAIWIEAEYLSLNGRLLQWGGEQERLSAPLP